MTIIYLGVMSPHTWFKIGHLIGLFVWIGGMFATYWLLRMHASAPKDMHDRFTVMERALALMMDIALTLAIGCGLYMALADSPNMFQLPKAKWLHAKLTVVVLMMLPVHGIVRKKIRVFPQGDLRPPAQWLWSMFLVGMLLAVFLVERQPF